jgi:hypothetical protein
MAKRNSKAAASTGTAADCRQATPEKVMTPAKQKKCIAKDMGHHACNCPTCEEGRRNP